MWALIEDNAIVKMINNPKGMVIGDTRYSKNIFSFRWSNAEREAIGLYEVVFDNSNKRDESYYINTNQSFDFADGVATASYGSATAKSLEDVLFTAQDEIDGIGIEGELHARGLKFNHKEIIKQQASVLLEATDWYNHKALDDETFTIPANIKTYRTNVRTKSNEMETAIDNASDVDALAALYVYNDSDPRTRPLGEFPILEI